MINFSIILADDEQQILFGMKNGIDWESLGFSVVGTAQNGKEALELIEEYHPDLLISDIKIPFMDGLELSRIIHDNYINTKIILFSGWDDFEYARTAISYGVSQYLMKPIDYDEMQKLLTNIHEELEKEYPGRKIHLIDTKGITLGSYAICKQIGQLYKDGKTIDELIELSKDIILLAYLTSNSPSLVKLSLLASF